MKGQRILLYLQGREEFGHDEGGLVLTQAPCHITRHAEVWVLVNGTRDQAAQVFALAEHVRKAVAKAWSCLDGRESNLSNVVGLCESKNGPHHVHSHQPVLNERIRLIHAFSQPFRAVCQPVIWSAGTQKELMSVLNAGTGLLHILQKGPQTKKWLF